MLNSKEKMMLWGFIGVALLMGLGFWGYYALKNSEVSPETRGNATSTPTNERESYLKNIKVTLTNEVYPTDIYQSNPRLRPYTGKVDYQITEIRFQDDKDIRTITYPSRYQKAPLDRPLQQILIFPNP